MGSPHGNRLEVSVEGLCGGASRGVYSCCKGWTLGVDPGTHPVAPVGLAAHTYTVCVSAFSLAQNGLLTMDQARSLLPLAADDPNVSFTQQGTVTLLCVCMGMCNATCNACMVQGLTH